jgi:hypothetical protein
MTQAVPVPIFIVNGEEVCPNGAPFTAMGEAVQRALEQSTSNARPFEDWETRDASGTIVDTSRALEAADDGAHFFVTIRVGVNG